MLKNLSVREIIFCFETTSASAAAADSFSDVSSESRTVKIIDIVGIPK